MNGILTGCVRMRMSTNGNLKGASGAFSHTTLSPHPPTQREKLKQFAQSLPFLILRPFWNIHWFPLFQPVCVNCMRMVWVPGLITQRKGETQPWASWCECLFGKQKQGNRTQSIKLCHCGAASILSLARMRKWEREREREWEAGRKSALPTHNSTASWSRQICRR